MPLVTTAMRVKLKFQRKYFILAILIFLVEILIALYVHDRIIRPYVGDFLVVILIYSFVKTFLDTPVLATALAVLLFSYLIEALQYFNILRVLGFQHSKLATVVLGNSFAWTDIFAYTAGILFVLSIEMIFAKRFQLKEEMAGK